MILDLQDDIRIIFEFGTYKIRNMKTSVFGTSLSVEISFLQTVSTPLCNDISSYTLKIDDLVS